MTQGQASDRATQRDPLQQAPTLDDDERVPIFGTWPCIYAAVVVCAVAVMALVYVFSIWPF